MVGEARCPNRASRLPVRTAQCRVLTEILPGGTRPFGWFRGGSHDGEACHWTNTPCPPNIKTSNRVCPDAFTYEITKVAQEGFLGHWEGRKPHGST